MGLLDTDVVVEIASHLELFFKGLSECGMLGSYSLQLQVPSVVDEVKLCNLIDTFAGNLQKLASDISDTNLPELLLPATEDHLVISTQTSKDDSQSTKVSPLDPLLPIEHKILWSEVLNTADVLPIIESSGHQSNLVTMAIEQPLEYIISESTKQTDVNLEQESKREDDSNTVKTSAKEEQPMFAVLTELPFAERSSTAVSDDCSVQATDKKKPKLTKKIRNSTSEANTSRKTRFKSNHVTCGKCSKIFRSVLELERHMDRKHGRDLKCDFCSAVFDSVTSLRQHCEGEHSIVGCFGCKLCGKRLNTRIAYSRHMDSHLGIKGAVCDVCGKTYSRADYLQRHHRVHNGEKPYSCEVCKKKFSNKSNLNTHSLIHSGLKAYSCDECDKSFFRLDKLKEHMFRHLKVKRFQCSICMKEYAEHRDLKKHLLHHQEKT